MIAELNGSDVHAQTGQPKVDRYKWVRPDKKGEFVYVAKGTLMSDKSYQRSLSMTRVSHIRANFSWIAFGVLIVARRADGRLWLVDGQHRHRAAMDRSDIVDVPCLVFNHVELSQEAKSFLEVQEVRGSMSSVDKFKARLVAQD